MIEISNEEFPLRSMLTVDSWQPWTRESWLQYYIFLSYSLNIIFSKYTSTNDHPKTTPNWNVFITLLISILFYSLIGQRSVRSCLCSSSLSGPCGSFRPRHIFSFLFGGFEECIAASSGGSPQRPGGRFGCPFSSRAISSRSIKMIADLSTIMLGKKRKEIWQNFL